MSDVEKIGCQVKCSKEVAGVSTKTKTSENNTMDYRVSGTILVAFVICICSRVQADFKYNVSLAQMSTCRHYNIPMIRGYNYADFFHIPHMKNNKLAENELLHLKFYVMTARDAHILLSATDHPRLLDRVYEIGKDLVREKCLKLKLCTF